MTAVVRFDGSSSEVRFDRKAMSPYRHCIRARGGFYLRPFGRPARAAAAGLYQRGEAMQLGAFSISLAVKDLAASKAFYEKLGFTAFAGDASQNWLILRNGDHVIGLFQGMFERNLLTFNPGWDQNAQKLPAFTDVRDLRRQLKARGVQPVQEADEGTAGPASFVVVDPDGNPILIDQHV